MKTRTNGREYDAVDRKAKRFFKWRSGTRAALKRAIRRRERRATATQVEE